MCGRLQSPAPFLRSCHEEGVVMNLGVVMKNFALVLMAAPLFAGNLETFADSSLNSTQRNTACLALRGDRSEDTVAALRGALTNINLQACAAANLRIAGAEAV